MFKKTKQLTRGLFSNIRYKAGIAGLALGAAFGGYKGLEAIAQSPQPKAQSSTNANLDIAPLNSLGKAGGDGRITAGDAAVLLRAIYGLNNVYFDNVDEYSVGNSGAYLTLDWSSGNGTSALEIPSGTFPNGSVVRFGESIASPQTPDSMTQIGPAMSVIFEEDSQMPITYSMSVPDNNFDGLIDGTATPVQGAQLYGYNPELGEWEYVPATFDETSGKLVASIEATGQSGKSLSAELLRKFELKMMSPVRISPITIRWWLENYPTSRDSDVTNSQISSDIEWAINAWDADSVKPPNSYDFVRASSAADADLIIKWSKAYFFFGDIFRRVDKETTLGSTKDGTRKIYFNDYLTWGTNELWEVGNDAKATGMVAAHEIGHYLGLNHYCTFSEQSANCQPTQFSDEVVDGIMPPLMENFIDNDLRFLPRIFETDKDQLWKVWGAGEPPEPEPTDLPGLLVYAHFGKYDGVSQLRTIKPDGTGMKIVYEDQTPYAEIDWPQLNNSRSRIIFESDVLHKLYVVNTDGNGFKILTSDYSFNGSFSWAYDGSVALWRQTMLTYINPDNGSVLREYNHSDLGFDERYTLRAHPTLDKICFASSKSEPGVLASYLYLGPSSGPFTEHFPYDGSDFVKNADWSGNDVVVLWAEASSPIPPFRKLYIMRESEFNEFNEVPNTDDIRGGVNDNDLSVGPDGRILYLTTDGKLAVIKPDGTGKTFLPITVEDSESYTKGWHWR